MICSQCKSEFTCSVGRVNQALKRNAPLYCGKQCAGLARRRKMPLTDEMAKALKREYDAKRRAEKHNELKQKKRDYYAANRVKILSEQSVYRAKHMDRHVEYCRRPEYKAWKAEYDKQKRFKEYGDFAEAAMLLEQVEKEISARATRYEIYVANGRFTRSAQQRRRELWQKIRNNRT